MRAMLGFVGETFDKACLTFHENRRYARTASYAQVTEPLYDRSVERWRHYRTHLEPVIPILAAGDRAARLHGSTDGNARAAPRPAPGTVPVPLADVLRIANEYERAGRLDEAKRLLDCVLAVSPNQGDALHLAGIVAFRLGDPAASLAFMEALAAPRHRYAAVSAQHLRGLPHARPAGRGAGRGAARHAAGAGRSAVPAQPGDHPLPPRWNSTRPGLRATRALRIDPVAARRAFRPCRGAAAARRMAEGWEEYEWRFRIGGAAPLMPPTDKPQWDGERVRRSHPAAGRRPGLRRRDPVQPLHSLGGGALPRYRDRLQRRDDARCCARSRPSASCSSAGRTCPDYAAFCALSGLPRLAGTRVDDYPRADPLSASPTRRASRTGRERLDGLVPQRCPPHRRDLGRPADAQQRPQPHRAAGGFRCRSATCPGIALLALQKGPKTGQAGG